MATLNHRRGGWLGAYSTTIRQILRHATSASVSVEPGTLQVGVTAFDVAPQLKEIKDFQSAKDVEETVLASCYIPVVWEEMKGNEGEGLQAFAWLDRIGGNYHTDSQIHDYSLGVDH